jgi:geranylgeranyl diphosphate synthase type I
MPTVWHLWGQAQGLNTGDAMHVLARLALLGLEENGISSDKVLRAARLLDETCLRLCEGQYMDISFEERLNIGVDDYLGMIGGKTAALFACSLKLGAMIGTKDEQTIGHMYEFGRNLGLAFQIQDDILGIWGEDNKTGKSRASDIMKKKKTLPVIYGMQKL